MRRTHTSYTKQIRKELKEKYPDLKISTSSINKVILFFLKNIIFVFLKWRRSRVHLKYMKIRPGSYLFPANNTFDEKKKHRGNV